MDDLTRRLLEAPPTALLMTMAPPNAVAFLIQSAVSMGEVWFVGRLGTEALAGIALVFPLLMLMQMMSGGAFGGAVAAAVARALGAGDRERADRLLWHVLVLALGGALVFALAFWMFGRAFLSFLGGEGEVLRAASRYGWVLCGGGLSIWLMGMISAVYRGTGNMRFPALLLIASAAIQVPLSGVLVLGAFGAPQLGIVGAAVSAVTSASILCVIMILRLTGASQSVRLRRDALHFSRDLFADVLRVAAPAAVSPLLTVATIVALTAIIARFGTAALAGYGIGARIELLLVPLVFGLGAAMTSLVGVATGAGCMERAERIGWTGGAMAAVLAGGVGLALALFPNPWIEVFSDDAATAAAATSYIRILGPVYALQGLGLSLYFASQGAGAMFWPLVATAVRAAAAVGGALLLGTPFGLEGVYAAAAVAMALYGVIIAASVRLGAWRR
jgi:putative MATE family efflux protein